MSRYFQFESTFQKSNRWTKAETSLRVLGDCFEINDEISRYKSCCWMTDEIMRRESTGWCLLSTRTVELVMPKFSDDDPISKRAIAG